MSRGMKMTKTRTALGAITLSLLAVCTVAVGSAQAAATCQPTSNAQNGAAAQASNAMRKGKGLAPLAPNARLAQIAAAHACDMARRGTMTHKGSTSAGPKQRAKAAGYAPRIIAENIAAGPFSQGQAMAAWAGSRGHAANILIPQVRDFGIGRAVGADGRTVYWSAVYAAPR